jgi:prepilin-type N-terminal cleavage/methylation domain-containing protein/prepilin-type processing-associated H-X9-DG protein
MTRPRPPFRGFTLIELLVSLGIIGILSALLLPSLGKAKAQARSASCKNNLHQIGLALTMYVGDFHQYPVAAEWSGAAFPWYVNQRILPYAGDNHWIFVCPAKETNEQPFSRFSYGYNAHGSGHLDGPNIGLGLPRFGRIAATQIIASTEMIAAGDNGQGALSNWLLNPNTHFSRGDEAPDGTWLPSTRHRGGANLLFCDGHTEYGKQERWIEKNDAARRRWNNDHEPHPETW